MEETAAWILVAVFASQLIMILVLPFAALHRIIETRRERARPAPLPPVVRLPAPPPVPPMPANDWLASHRLRDMRPALAQRANDNR